MRVARKYKGSSLMRRMAHTFLSGKGSVVVADAVLLVVAVADFLPPGVGFHFDGEAMIEVEESKKK